MHKWFELNSYNEYYSSLSNSGSTRNDNKKKKIRIFQKVFLIFYFIFEGTGVRNQGLVLARQALYC
jgi:hypothetical protein